MNNVDATQKFELPGRSDNRSSPGMVELSVRPDDRYSATTAAVSKENSAPAKSDHQDGRWLTRGPDGDWYYYDGAAWVMTSPPNDDAMSQAAPQNAATSASAAPAKRLIALGYLCAVISVFLAPIILGPVGIACGSRAGKLGEKKKGRAVVITSAVCMVIGFGVSSVLHVPAFR